MEHWYDDAACQGCNCYDAAGLTGTPFRDMVFLMEMVAMKGFSLIIPADPAGKRIRKTYAPLSRVVRDKTKYDRRENRRIARQER